MRMQFGVNFFPTVSPREKSGAVYFDECLALAELADRLGYSSLKTVEHYFYAYGGYSPDPVVFLAAAAQRTSRIRLVTGAVIPSFNHPLQLAGKLAMLDNLSHGRLDVGFGRAILPGEFDAFQVPMEQSRQRFDEGIEAVRRLWTDEDVVWNGAFHQFGPLTMLPRPFQQPHPPIWIAATFNPETFEGAGRRGYHLMLVPYTSTHEQVGKLVRLYRDAWRDAGHRPGREQIQMGFHCYLAEDGRVARAEAREYFQDYAAKQLAAMQVWDTRRSPQYPGYEHLLGAIQQHSYQSYLADDRLLVGSPDEVADQVARIRVRYGEVEPSLQVNFGSMPLAKARRSLELFARYVMPRFSDSAAPAPSAGAPAAAPA